ncbi:hypothetical protein [Nocardioides aromaticivorans]|uniref:hypothetical protein n=1 Tax=Nocardioides aromaticivorans TaxID=200618 RepID=UPI001A90BDE1|nr:hypothetical protein [Nocardioides aromaticivorans]
MSKKRIECGTSEARMAELVASIRRSRDTAQRWMSDLALAGATWEPHDWSDFR